MLIPRARRSAGATWWQGAFHLFGGFGANGTVAPTDVSAELWRYDDGWRRLSDSGPPAARYASLCGIDSELYLFGGCGAVDGQMAFYDHLWRFDRRWHALETRLPRPAPRYAGALARDDDRLILFGGMAQTSGGRKAQYFGDVWAVEPRTGTWSRLGDSDVAGRYGFGWVQNGTSLYIFGGFDGEKDRSDLWRFEFAGHIWHKIADGGPPARYCPAMALVDEKLVLFGGRSKTNPKLNFGDTWLFDGTWCRIDGAGPGYHAKTACASGENALWVFGGEGPSGHVSDLWRYDTGGWSRLHGCRDDDPILW